MRHSQFVRALFGSALLVVAISCGANQPGDDESEVGTTSQAVSRAEDVVFTTARIRAAANCPSCEVLNVARLNLPETAVLAASAKIREPEGAIRSVTLDDTGAALVEKVLIDAERAAARSKYGKLRPELYAWLQTAGDTDRAWVWIRAKVPALDFGRREDDGSPAAEAKRAAIARAVDDVTAPIHAWLAGNAPEATYGDFGGPIVRAQLTATEVRQLESLGVVGELGTDKYPGRPLGSPWGSVSQWGATIRLADAHALTTGSGTNICVKEDTKADDVSRLVIAATANTTGMTSEHARLMDGILRNTDTSPYTSVAPAATIYAGNCEFRKI